MRWRLHMNTFHVATAAVCIIFLSSIACIGSENINGCVLGVPSSALSVSISPAAAAFNLGQSQPLTATPSGGSGSYTGYQWYVGGSAQTGQTASTFNFSPASANMYSISVTVTDNTGATSAQSNATMIMVVVGQTVSVSPGSASLDMGQSQLFTAVFNSGNSGSLPWMYQWYVDGTAQSGQTASTFNYAPASAGTYSITVMIFNSTGFPVMQSAPATVTASGTTAATPTLNPTQNPTANPTQPPTTVPATTGDGSTVDLAISGNIASSQMSNVAIIANQSASTTRVSFTVTGASGTEGLGNITIPKSLVPYGTTPTIYIDDQPAQNQGFTQDSDNYYVWYTTHFSTHQVSIVFTGGSSGSEGTASLIGAVYGAIGAIVVVAAIIAALMLMINRRKGTISEN